MTRFGPRALCVATWNIDGVTDAKLRDMLDTCEDMEFCPDVLLLVETHRQVGCGQL